MIPTQRQLDVLNHVVVDGQAWIDDDIARHTARGNMSAEEIEAHVTKAVEAKVATHEAKYDEAVAKGNYRNRLQRDADDEQRQLDSWADDLADAKKIRISECKHDIARLYMAHVDHHYLKKNRKAIRGQSVYTIPSSVETYEDALTAVCDEAEIAINALTTKKDIFNYWPDLPEEPKGGN